jgi:hypothetical protein
MRFQWLLAATNRKKTAIPPTNLLRAKGVLCLMEEPKHRTVSKRLRQRWSLNPADEWGEEPRSSPRVILGLCHEIENSYVKQMTSSNLHLSILK